eukprot:4975287-Prymnesium_polylepis.2
MPNSTKSNGSISTTTSQAIDDLEYLTAEDESHAIYGLWSMHKNHIPAMDGHMAAAHVKQPVSGTSDRPAEGVTAAEEPDSPASS